jgi:hypothetical protein
MPKKDVAAMFSFALLATSIVFAESIEITSARARLGEAGACSTCLHSGNAKTHTEELRVGGIASSG